MAAMDAERWLCEHGCRLARRLVLLISARAERGAWRLAPPQGALLVNGPAGMRSLAAPMGQFRALAEAEGWALPAIYLALA